MDDGNGSPLAVLEVVVIGDPFADDIKNAYNFRYDDHYAPCMLSCWWSKKFGGLGTSGALGGGLGGLCPGPALSKRPSSKEEEGWGKSDSGKKKKKKKKKRHWENHEARDKKAVAHCNQL
ncbi:hypothetical protein LguiA_003853 [Lonicera macranthoides]